MNENNEAREDEVIQNSKPYHLYQHECEKGRFFQAVYHDDSEVHFNISSKTLIKVIFLKETNDLEGLEIVKTVSGQEKQRLRLNKFNLAQVKEFLSFICQLNLGEISERRLRLHDEESYTIDDNLSNQIKKILFNSTQSSQLESWLNEGLYTAKDLVNTGFRKKQLSIFEKLLVDENYWKIYANEEGISSYSEEKIWQHHFEKNSWVLGYGLQYRYISVLQREAHLSSSTLNGRNTVITDYLMGDNRFTTFVELKKPSTKLFNPNFNRSGTWCLSNDLIYAVSQILEQKAAGQIKIDGNQYLNGNHVKQNAYDSKVILVIGNWKEIEESANDLEREIKRKTFELFRRDSRNIEILTYDELFERANFIVSEHR